MAKNRYRQKAKLKRQYTLTGTKAFAAFWLSIFFSLILDSYFDQYGPRVISQIKDLMMGSASAANQNDPNAQRRQKPGGPRNPLAAQPGPARSAFDNTFHDRLNQLDRTQENSIQDPPPLDPAKSTAPR